MEDKNNLIVYCEYDEGRIADVSLELLTKGRTLATRLGCRLEALVLGDKLDGIEQELFPYASTWSTRCRTIVCSPTRRCPTQAW